MMTKDYLNLLERLEKRNVSYKKKEMSRMILTILILYQDYPKEMYRFFRFDIVF